MKDFPEVIFVWNSIQDKIIKLKRNRKLEDGTDSAVYGIKGKYHLNIYFSERCTFVGETVMRFIWSRTKEDAEFFRNGNKGLANEEI